MQDRIPQRAIDAIADHINQRYNKDHGVPILGNDSNSETPKYFEIKPFDEIDETDVSFYAIDGSTNSHSFYNGLTIGLYRCGYVCFQRGEQVRMNGHDDPVILGQSYTPEYILITCEDDNSEIYEELLKLPSVHRFIKFLADTPENIFPFGKDQICSSTSKLLSFCQEILEWALVYEIACREEIKQGDIILRDGTLRSVNIKQEYLIELGKFLRQEKGIILVSVTKNSPIKMELSYTFKKIDDYLQDKLKPQYPFKQDDPRRQKLCCWFEVPDTVLEKAYRGGMYSRKELVGGRGVGLFFAARLDYVEKLQNYDWVVVDVNILDAVPGIEQKDKTRDMERLSSIFSELTRLTQEHYILGYPYPLVEAHNFVTLKSDFKEEVINRVKHSLYKTKYVDHVDIENMFLDIHTRF